MTIDSPQETSSPDVDRYAVAQAALGATRYGHAEIDAVSARAAGRAWWDADADEYQASHGEFLGDAEFRWCPEGLVESEVKLLGEVEGRTVLEVGCGSASCSRWLAAQGANPVALDISAGMLRHATIGAQRTGLHVPLIQASVDALPFADDSFDIVCSAFGALPFVADLDLAMREVSRVLRPGGRWVFAVTHPMRWIFPDDPGPAGLTVRQSYFDRAPYIEADENGTPTYAEFHRTLGDLVRAIVQADLRLTDLIEPEWPEGHEREWGQWSPLRGRLFPGTAIFCCRSR